MLSVATILATFPVASCASTAEQQHYCRSSISARDAKRFVLPPLPDGATVRLCASSDKDGIRGNLEFDADPDATRRYLESMGMDWGRFVEASAGKVKNLSTPRNGSWNLKEGERYRWNFASGARGEGCLMDYTAFVRAEKQWDGKAYIGFYCMQ
ncbi:hypothetical protein ABT040_26015 [Streptomyces sp. NPDC002688]|uniref:hypothetical protein n=1 Tax=Streptomyces sp. NPDC002688 TaxID=3154423 RepID=UPI00332282A7